MINTNAKYKAAISLSLVTGLLLCWVTLAVGIFGEPDILEVISLAAAAVIAVISKFNNRGMSLALFTAALVQLITAIIALINGSASEIYWQRELGFNSVFVGLFLLASAIFWNSSDEKRNDLKH